MIEFDDKGKFFTNIINKDPVPATIQTVLHRIHGNIHIQHDQRVIDGMNISEPFLAVTDAIVFAPDGQPLYQCKFMTIRRELIVWMIPDSELSGNAKGE